MTEAGGIRLRMDDAVATITLDRPERRNAMRRTDRTALRAALQQADRDPGVHVIVLTGAGGHFCAGGDINEFTEQRDRNAAHEYALTYAQAVFRAMRELGTPTVARVEGAAAGAGMYLALGCDIVVAAEGAYFHPGHLDLAVVPDWGAIWLMPRLVGVAKAKALLLTGRRLQAEDAHRYGLVAECVPPSALDDTVAGYCHDIARIPPVPMGWTRQGLDRSLDLSLPEFLEWESQATADVMSRPEHHERVDAFLNRSR